MEINSKKIELPDNMRKKIDNLTNNKMVRYIEGSHIEFIETNMTCVDPVKIIIETCGKELVSLYYGKYHIKEELFLYDPSNKCSWKKLKELLAVNVTIRM